MNQRAALSEGEFREVFPDPPIETSRASSVERVIVATGKVYYELLEHRHTHLIDTPIICNEQLYPFPATQVAAELARYPDIKTVVLCQEESRIQGAWSFVEPQLSELLPSGATPRYAGPDAAASTAPGYHSVHVERQAALVERAFEG